MIAMTGLIDEIVFNVYVGPSDSEITVILGDAAGTTKQKMCEFTYVEWGAILALAFGSEDYPKDVAKALYDIATPALTRELGPQEKNKAIWPIP